MSGINQKKVLRAPKARACNTRWEEASERRLAVHVILGGRRPRRGDLGEEASPGSFSWLRREGHRAQQACRPANGLVKLAHGAAGR